MGARECKWSLFSGRNAESGCDKRRRDVVSYAAAINLIAALRK